MYTQGASAWQVTMVAGICIHKVHMHGRLQWWQVYVYTRRICMAGYNGGRCMYMQGASEWQVTMVAGICIRKAHLHGRLQWWQVYVYTRRICIAGYNGSRYLYTKGASAWQVTMNGSINEVFYSKLNVNSILLNKNYINSIEFMQ